MPTRSWSSRTVKSSARALMTNCSPPAPPTSRSSTPSSAPRRPRHEQQRTGSPEGARAPQVRTIRRLSGGPPDVRPDAGAREVDELRSLAPAVAGPPGSGADDLDSRGLPGGDRNRDERAGPED